MKRPEFITVIYAIEDWEEWGKTNPLHYKHNGLKAVRVALNDALEELENERLEAKEEYPED